VGATSPYALYTVKENEAEQMSANYIGKFLVMVRIWAKAKSTQTGPLAVALDTAMSYAALTIPNAASVIHVRPTGGDLTIAPQPREAEDVLVAERAWEVWVTGTRT
jgi:hypothetical protein